MPAAMALSVERKSIRVRGTFADGRFVFLFPYQPGALIFFICFLFLLVCVVERNERSMPKCSGFYVLLFV